MNVSFTSRIIKCSKCNRIFFETETSWLSACSCENIDLVDGILGELKDVKSLIF